MRTSLEIQVRGAVEQLYIARRGSRTYVSADSGDVDTGYPASPWGGSNAYPTSPSGVDLFPTSPSGWGAKAGGNRAQPGDDPSEPNEPNEPLGSWKFGPLSKDPPNTGTNSTAKLAELCAPSIDLSKPKPDFCYELADLPVISNKPSEKTSTYTLVMMIAETQIPAGLNRR